MIRILLTWFYAVAQIARPFTCLQASLLALTGVYLADRSISLLDLRTLAAASVIFLAVASSFAINDYCDLLPDRISHPERPIPSGRIGRPSVLIVSVCLAAFSVALAFSLQPLMGVLATGNLLISWAYSFYLKGRLLWGNAAIAYLNASMPIFGGMSSNKVLPVHWLVVTLIFLLILAQEILYNIDDRVADGSAGILTTAVRLGNKNSVRLFFTIFIFLLGVLFFGLTFSPVPNFYLGFAVLGVLLPFIKLATLLKPPFSPPAVKQAMRLMLFIRVCGLMGIFLL